MLIKIARWAASAMTGPAGPVMYGLAAAAVLFGAVAWGQRGYTMAEQYRADFAAFRGEAAQKALVAEMAQRDIETARQEAQQEVAHAIALSRAREAAAARADGLAAGAAAERVRSTTAAAVAASRAACEDPAAAGRCEAIAGALADAFGACVEGHRLLGADATEALGDARARGGKCAGLYDALTGGPQ